MTVNTDANKLERRIVEEAHQNYTMYRQRKGQALMNALRTEAPELYEIISGTPADCFYRDEKVSLVMDELGFKTKIF